jgi:hypothetical protein
MTEPAFGYLLACRRWVLTLREGGKASNWEGGIRVNGWVSGGALAASLRGTKCSGLVAVWDWVCTFYCLFFYGHRFSLPIPPLSLLSLSLCARARTFVCVPGMLADSRAAIFSTPRLPPLLAWTRLITARLRRGCLRSTPSITLLTGSAASIPPTDVDLPGRRCLLARATPRVRTAASRTHTTPAPMVLTSGAAHRPTPPP